MKLTFGTGLRLTAPLSVLALAAVVVTGCTTGTPAQDSPAPTADAAPTESLVAPTPIIDVDCDDLVQASDLTGLFGAEVDTQDPSTIAGVNFSGYIPATYALRQAGGIVCAWAADVDASGSRPLLTVSWLPDASRMGDWSDFASLMDFPAGCTGGYCAAGELLDDGSWLRIDAEGGTNDEGTRTDAFAALVASAVEVIGTAAPADAWEPPADIVAIPSECAELVDEATVAAAFGLSGGTSITHPGGGPNLPTSARPVVGATDCDYASPSELMYRYAEVSTLPAGAWAFQEHDPTSGESLSLDGLGDDDEAWITCAQPDAECVVDVVVAGNWIRVESRPVDQGVYDTVPPIELAPIAGRPAAVSIAESVIESIAG